MNVLSHSVVSDSVTPSTVAHQAPLSMDFPGKNTGVGCHFLLQGNLSHLGIEPRSPALQEDSIPPEPPGKPPILFIVLILNYLAHSSASTRLSTAGVEI